MSPESVQNPMCMWAYYIRQAGRDVIITQKEVEHEHHLQLGHTDKSGLADHGW